MAPFSLSQDSVHWSKINKQNSVFIMHIFRPSSCGFAFINGLGFINTVQLFSESGRITMMSHCYQHYTSPNQYFVSLKIDMSKINKVK